MDSRHITARTTTFHISMIIIRIHVMLTYYSYTCLCCFYLLVIWITMLITCIIVPCSRIHDIWLFPVTDMDFLILDMRAIDMRYVDFHIYCSRYIVPIILFPIYCSWFPLYCSMLSTELWSSYHVTRIMYCYLFLLCWILDISDHNDNWGMGETLRLIRSYRVMYWIHIVSPTVGDGSATYQ